LRSKIQFKNIKHLGNIPLFFGGSILADRAIDGLAIVDNQKLIGELKFSDILKYIYPLRDSQKTPTDLLNVDILEIANRHPNIIKSSDRIKDVLNRIELTRLGIIHVVSDGDYVGSVSLHDFLECIANKKLDCDVDMRKIYSKPLVTVEKDATLNHIIKTMMDNNVRRVLLDHDGKYFIIDDRDVSNMIFSVNFSHKPFSEIFNNHMIVEDPIKKVEESKGLLSDIAQMIIDSEKKCLLVDNGSIITPWDVVVKGLKQAPKETVEQNFETLSISYR